MNSRPSITPETFKAMKEPSDKLNVLFDMQMMTHENLTELHEAIKKRRFFDRTATIIGGIVGGVLGALGVKVGA